MTRTDIHRPSLLDPSEYEFMAAFYQGSSEAMHRAYDADHGVYDRAVAKYEVFQGNHATRTTCDHCGAAFTHGVLFLHTPTQQLIHVGHICAADTIGLPSRAAAVRRSAEKAQREEAARQKLLAETQSWRDERPALVAFLAEQQQLEGEWRAWNDEHYDGHGVTGRNPITPPHPFIMSMVHAINRWGSLTERQEAAVVKFMAEARRRASEPEPEPEPEPTSPLEAGRRIIRGTVLGLKDKDTPYGIVTKMLVREDDTFNKVWGTVPSRLFELAYEKLEGESIRGRRVSFTATVQVSGDDIHFGFFSRPTNANLEV